MNPPYTQEINFIKMMKAPTNLSSNQGIQKSIKIGNIPTLLTHIVMYIMPYI